MGSCYLVVESVIVTKNIITMPEQVTEAKIEDIEPTREENESGTESDGDDDADSIPELEETAGMLRVETPRLWVERRLLTEPSRAEARRRPGRSCPSSGSSRSLESPGSLSGSPRTSCSLSTSPTCTRTPPATPTLCLVRLRSRI